MASEHRLDLMRHPSSRLDSVESLRVLVRRSTSGELALVFSLDGDLSRMLIPAPGVSRIGVELWRHTCFEAFIALEGQTAYHEFNFAPSGEWTVYAMRGYRDGDALADERMAPQIVVRGAGSRVELDARIRLDSLSAAHPGAPLRIGFAAVIETREGLSYWALCHPRDQPDFHDAGGFALLLEPPSPE